MSTNTITETNADKLTIEDLRRLVRWCDNQTESNWRPDSGIDLTLGQILACYHAANAAGYFDLDGWFSEEPDAARDAWVSIRGV